MGRAGLFLATASCALVAAHASETTSYTYDELGRLTGTNKTGTVNGGVATSTSYDPAGNRLNYTVSGVAAPAPPPAFSVSDASVTEGGALQFTVSKSGSTGSSFSIGFATADGTAGAADYSATSGTLTFAAAETSKTVSVATTGDTLDESNENLSLNLAGASGGASIADGQGIGTIVDDDDPPPSPPPPPVFSITGASANEGSNLVFTITKSGAATTSFSVSYATSNGSAAAYSDYYPASGALTFAANQTSQTVSVATIKDNNAEPAETISMTLSAPTGGATINAQGNPATGTIAASFANSPPTPVTDSVSIARCTAGSFNVIANDTDPEGDLPLQLTDVGGGALQMGLVSVGSSTNVAWAKASQTGLFFATYTVKDSRNATATGNLQVTVTGTGTGPCP